MKKHKGFTLIELIIVIVILGILAAYAIPKYMNVDKEARIAVVKGLKGSIHAAADMVHAIAIAKGATTTVDINPGTTVTITGDRYPTADAAGINTALADTSGFNPVEGTGSIRYEKIGAGDEPTCSVTYTEGDPPDITFADTGC